MSSVEQGDNEEVCGSCGKAAVDEIKLKKCACNLVKYCSVDCQKNHRQQHKKACKKRMAEIRDDRLFTQPEGSHLGECAICCLPLSLDRKKSGIYACCSQRICNGCAHANVLREEEGGIEPRCPFCREILPRTNEEIVQNQLDRAKANDPVALGDVGKKLYDEGNYEGAIENITKAAKLGEIEAHQNLSIMYRKGAGVEKDKKKEIYHLEEAAIGGHPDARYNLGYYEWNSGRFDRAMKHYIIAANLGCDDALDAVTKRFERGLVSKEYYDTAHCGHQAAVDATKSQQRDAATERAEGGLLCIPSKNDRMVHWTL